MTTAPGSTLASVARRPAAERGTLQVRAKALASIIEHAADGVPGTVRQSRTQWGLTRGGLPSVDVTLLGGRAWVELDVAAPWPCAAERLADNVRRQVHAEAEDLSAVPLERLDVVLHVVTDLAERRRVE